MYASHIPYRQSILAVAVATIISTGVTACGSGAVDEILEKVTLTQTDIEAGELCAAGGIRIDAGTDVNGDGILEGEEISSSSTLCSGGTPIDGIPLTTLSATDLCPNGGNRIDSGIDKDKDGKLVGDEILTTGMLCESGAAAWDNPPKDTKPIGPVAQYKMLAKGGEGTDDGGDGGQIDIFADSGADLLISDTGVADASFTTPEVAPALGIVPMIVSADMTIPVDPDHAEYPESGGDYYYVEDEEDWRISKFDGTSVTTVTGMQIEEGVTLTLPSMEELSVAKDIVNKGMIKTLDGVSLYIRAANYHGSEGSAINIVGADSLEATGTDGASVSIDAMIGIYNKGDINTSGGNGVTGGGNAGDIRLEAMVVYQEGVLTANGGNDDNGELDENGGSAGSIELEMDGNNVLGRLFNSGNMSAVGGTGYEGGESGKISFSGMDNWPNYADPAYIRNSGNLSAAVGAGSYGGEGFTSTNCGSGAINLCSSLGIINSGDLTTKPADSLAGPGSSGGSINLRLEPYWGDGEGVFKPGDMIVSGNFDTSGAKGGGESDGGQAGDIRIDASYEGAPERQQVSLLGYSSLSTQGGDGNDQGGEGGEIEIANDVARLDPDRRNPLLPGGSTRIYADLVTDGGSGDEGENSGYISIYSGEIGFPGADWQQVLVYGDISMKGGNSIAEDDGGWANNLWISGIDGITVNNINASGGNSVDYEGGSGGWIEFESLHGDIALNGDVVLNGGNSVEDTGGYGGGLRVIAAGDVKITGTITADGGSSENSSGGSANDEDGIIISGATVTNEGTLSAKGGTGDPNGEDGLILLIP